MYFFTDFHINLRNLSSPFLCDLRSHGNKWKDDSMESKLQKHTFPGQSFDFQFLNPHIIPWSLASLRAFLAGTGRNRVSHGIITQGVTLHKKRNTR